MKVLTDKEIEQECSRFQAEITKHIIESNSSYKYELKSYMEHNIQVYRLGILKGVIMVMGKLMSKGIYISLEDKGIKIDLKKQ